MRVMQAQTARTFALCFTLVCASLAVLKQSGWMPLNGSGRSAPVLFESSVRSLDSSRSNILAGKGLKQGLAAMGTGLPVFVGLQAASQTTEHNIMYRGRSQHRGQSDIKLGENDQAQADWQAAGIRGSALGSVGAPQIDHYVEEAAADCGSDPNCFCDWAGTPRKCLFDYCCGTIAHSLGQTRGDYTSAAPTGAQLVDAYQQQKHLESWQRICQPEQTYYDHK